MKKTYWIVSFIILLTILLFILVLFVFKNYNLEKEITKWNQFFYQTIEKMQQFQELNTGTITGTINYNGAHKEPYSIPLSYEFQKDTKNNMIIKSEKGQTTISWQEEYYDIIEFIKNIQNTKELIQRNNDTCNINNINQTFHENFQTCNISYEYQGILKNIKNIKLDFDKTSIIIENNTISIKYDQNEIAIHTLTNGYSININNRLKIQAELKENENIYHLIIEDKSFLIERNSSSLKLTSQNKIENFHSLELIFEKKENTLENNQILNTEEIPFLKYLTSLKLPDWRIQ